MLAIVLGTRPEIIKTAPLVLEAQRRGIPIGVIHTGQHYSAELDRIFFEELGLPEPLRQLSVGSHPAALQIGLMIERLAAAFEEIKPTCVLVQGDTNSVLAGALTAYKMNIPVAHLEAGLRSDDFSMPEEMNRILADRLSRWLFCPTEVQRERLRREGIEHDGVQVVGNTIVDAVQHFSEVARTSSRVLERMSVAEGKFFLLTLHRPSNVDEPERLRRLLSMLDEAARALDYKIVFPIHPRTRQAMESHGLVCPSSFVTCEPLGFLDLLRLEQTATVILTDSGGIQEEACILQVPAITLRSNTERPETLEGGANMLYGGSETGELSRLLAEQIKRPRTWSNPFGDGQTARRVLETMKI